MQKQRLFHYAALMRLDKPIGILLLLWPTLWALWLANEGKPANAMIFLFVMGVIVMRSAGCVLNDIADKQVDAHVRRTKNRPLAAGTMSVKEAYGLAAILLGIAFVCVLFLNAATIMLAFVGLGLAMIYPFLKRITYLPQLGLGMAFSWGIPMAFAAQTGGVPLYGWFVFLVGVIWPLIYDTMYAMVDRQDDLQIGVKSTAILFNAMDNWIIGLLQLLFVVLLFLLGFIFELKMIYTLSVVIVLGFFMYQQWLLQSREESNYFKAFLNNHWVGLTIFMGIMLSYGI